MDDVKVGCRDGHALKHGTNPANNDKIHVVLHENADDLEEVR
jgi:hypothetical protein